MSTRRAGLDVMSGLKIKTPEQIKTLNYLSVKTEVANVAQNRANSRHRSAP